MEVIDDLPIIESIPIRPTSLAKIDLKAAALSRFGEWKPTAESIVKKYKGVIFAEVDTPKGYKALTEAIAEVREPRFSAQRVSESSKSELAAVSKAVGAEKDAVTAYLAETEKELVAQKAAEDARRTVAEAEAKRIEDERKAAHESGIARIRSYLAAAQGISSERIAAGIDKLTAMVFTTAEWEEFAVPAANAQCETIEALRGVLATTKAAEEAEAAAAAQRIEQARVAEEQRLEAKRLDEARALIAAEAKKAADKLAADQAEFEKERAEWRAKAAAEAPKLTSTLVDSVVKELDATPVVELMGHALGIPLSTTGVGTDQPRDETPAAQVTFAAPLTSLSSTAERAAEFTAPVIEARTMSTGVLCDRLGAGITVTAACLAALGFKAITLKGKAGSYWLDSDWPAIKVALAKHIVARV